MDRRWKGSADKELREVLKFFRWQPAISLLPTWTKASRGWNLGFYEQASQVALVRNLPASAGDIRDMDSISGSGRSPAGGHSNPLQYSCLENPMDRGAWQATVHRFAKSGTQLKWLNRHTHSLSHIALLTGTEKELRFMFNFCFSCFLICSCILLDSLRYLLLHYFQELLDNLPQILFPLQMLWTCWLEGTQLLWSPWWLIPIPFPESVVPQLSNERLDLDDFFCCFCF